MKSEKFQSETLPEVLVTGYDQDSRESYEIPEIRQWFSKSLEVGVPWFYFLGKFADGMGMRVLLFSCCEISVKSKQSGKTFVELLDVEQVRYWMDVNFHNLNRFCEENDIPESIIKEMSEEASSLVQGFMGIASD